MSLLESFLSYPSCQMVNFNYSAYCQWCQSCQFSNSYWSISFWISNFVISLINLFIVSVNLQYQWIYSISIFNCTWIQSFLLRRYQEHMIHSYFIVTHLSSVERHRQVLYIICFSTQALDVCSSLRDSKRGCVCVSCEGDTTFWGQPVVGPTAIWE